ncbi:hypothetical protein FA13DRAFT_1392181 [Coprinellus micaceus]|uniref:Uncharacterized protein n=1 Tax=Coprinellus micaceus TaxID=71717 RepID=A0A4Y7SQH8_COPMI|nr:hypothetical protein FA13DRAFT_1392181 [Coprinellus micaceus]
MAATTMVRLRSHSNRRSIFRPPNSVHLHEFVESRRLLSAAHCTYPLLSWPYLDPPPLFHPHWHRYRHPRPQPSNSTLYQTPPLSIFSNLQRCDAIHPTLCLSYSQTDATLRPRPRLANSFVLYSMPAHRTRAHRDYRTPA